MGWPRLNSIGLEILNREDGFYLGFGLMVNMFPKKDARFVPIVRLT